MSAQAGVSPVYLSTLVTYYEEEIEGEAFFAAVAEATPPGDRRDKLTLLAQVEAHAAAAVAPLLDRHGLTPQPVTQLRARGQREGRAVGADWDALIADMNASYAGYLADFEALEAIAPAPDLPRLRFLTAHEHAALAFLALEATTPELSAAPLRQYLTETPDTSEEIAA